MDRKSSSSCVRFEVEVLIFFVVAFFIAAGHGAFES
jgi:hypothetical protein